MAEGRTRRCGRRPAGGWNLAAGGSPVAVAAPSGRLRPGGFGGLEAEHVSCTPAGAREGKGSAKFDRTPLCARCMPNPSSSRGALKTLRHTAVPPRGWRFKRVGLAELARLYAPLYRAAAAPSSQYGPRLNLGSISAQSRLNLG